MPLDKKPPRFVPTLTEIVRGKPPILAEFQPDTDGMHDEPESESDVIAAKALAAAEAFMANRMPELVAQHMAACEEQLRQELKIIIKNMVEGSD